LVKVGALDDNLNYNPGYPIYKEYHDYKTVAKRAAEASVSYKEYTKRAPKSFAQRALLARTASDLALLYVSLAPSPRQFCNLS
jgi:hypothetical protein